MGKRRRARELAIQVLFYMEVNPAEPEEAFDLVCQNFDGGETIGPFARELVLGVYEKRPELDRLIIRASKNWRLERMPYVDRSILRMATFEILYMEDVPPKVSIDEAVDIGKRFGTEDSGSFINGVLDNIYGALVQEGRLKKTEQ
jgi:transcription antitermination factor NusB